MSAQTAGRSNYAIAASAPRFDQPMVPTFTPEPWVADALCAQVDAEAFFPEKGGSTRQAKAICARCDVAAQCLEYALRHNERHGIWGGVSERERRKLENGRAA